jgi:Fe-S-cluster-containing hydrogenase component 2
VTVKVNADECVGCENCVPVCPVEAITLVDGKAVIDQKKCNQCLTCIEECPTDAIQEE